MSNIVLHARRDLHISPQERFQPLGPTWTTLSVPKPDCGSNMQLETPAVPMKWSIQNQIEELDQGLRQKSGSGSTLQPLMSRRVFTLLDTLPCFDHPVPAAFSQAKFRNCTNSGCSETFFVELKPPNDRLES